MRVNEDIKEDFTRKIKSKINMQTEKDLRDFLFYKNKYNKYKEVLEEILTVYKIKDKDQYYLLLMSCVSHGIMLEVGLYCDDISVRIEVAKQRYRLNILINDSSPLVREEVARQGYGLNKLIKDENKYVRQVAFKTALKEQKRREELKQQRKEKRKDKKVKKK